MHACRSTLEDPTQLTRRQARRIAVQAQLLDAARPSDVLDTVRHLTLVQHDQTAAVAPNADLVLWSRLGDAYKPEDLAVLLAEQSVVELDMMLRPAEDMALHRAEMAAWPAGQGTPNVEAALEAWVEANDECRRHILERLYDENPLTAGAFPDLTMIPWQSSGWNNDRNVIRLLDMMARRGEVAVTGRRGRERLWDLAERVYPDDPIVPREEALRIRAERELHALGVARTRSSAGEAATIEGLRGRWRVDPAYLDRPFEGRAALLSPLDRLVFDRNRMAQLFDFDYQLEMYKPVANRRWGYFALPILYGDRLVGKLDATTDRAAGVLRVDAIHEDVRFDRKMRSAIDDEIASLADLLLVRVRTTG